MHAPERILDVKADETLPRAALGSGSEFRYLVLRACRAASTNLVWSYGYVYMCLS